MRGSKRILTNIIVLSTGVGLISCTKATREGKNNSASYYVAQMSSSGNFKAPADNRTIDGWGLADEKIFTFQACVADNARQLPMIAHKFTITGPDAPKTKPEIIETDTKGCLNWTEVFAFDPLADPQYLRLKRVLQPNGIQRGEVTIEFGVNPWSGFNGSEAPIVDFTIEKERVVKQFPISDKAATRAFRASATQKPVPVVIERASYQVLRRQKNAVGFPVQITFAPGYRLTSMSDLPQNKSFVDARFMVKPQLIRIYTDANGKLVRQLKWADVPPVLARFENNMAFIEFPDVRFATLEPVGRYILILSVTPTGNPPKGLGAFEEVFELGGRGAAFPGGGSFQRITDPSFVTGSSGTGSIRAMVNRLQLEQNGQSVETTAPFKIGPLTLSSVSFQEVKFDWGDDRQLTMNVSVPILDINDSPMDVGRKFKVRLEPKNSGLPQATNADQERDLQPGGMLYFQNAVLHMNYFKKQQLMPYELRIEYIPDPGQPTDGVNLVQTKLVCINLGPTGAIQFLPEEFLGDPKNCAGPSIMPGAKPLADVALPGPARVPTLRIDKLSWSRDIVGTKYSVNDDLSIGIQHILKFTITPSVIRFDSPAGLEAVNNNPEKLRPGYYLLTTTLYLNDTGKEPGDKGEVKNILASYQRIVRTENGSLIADMELNMNTGSVLPIMILPNYMVVQVNQIEQKNLVDKDGNLKPDAEYTILPPSKTDLTHQRSFVFQFSPDGSSAGVIENSKDPRLLGLFAELEKKQPYQRHKEWLAEQAQLREETRLVQQDPDFWKKVAQRPKDLFSEQNDKDRTPAERVGFVHLKPIEVTDKENLNRDLLSEIKNSTLRRTFVPYASTDLFKRALKCLDQTSWGHLDSMHECIKKAPELAPAAKQLCSLLSLKSQAQPKRQWENIPFYAPRDSGVQSYVWNSMPFMGYKTPMDKCLESPLEFLRVQQKTFVYEVDHNVPSEQLFVSGFVSRLSLSNDFGIGSFYGTDTGGGDISSIRASVAVNDVFPFGKTGNLINGGMIGVGLFGVSLDRSHNAMLIDFQRNYHQNAGSAGLGATLNFEHANFNIPVRKFRDCYTLRLPKLDNSNGYMFCFPIETIESDRPARMVKQRYYTVYNAAANGTMINSDDVKNRFMIEFRGEDSYYNFMATMEEGMRPFFDGRSIPLEVADMLECNKKELRDRIFEIPGTLSSSPPPLADFFRIANRGNTQDMWDPITGYIPWNPFETFGTRRLGPINDPETQLTKDTPTELAPTKPRSQWCAARR